MHAARNTLEQPDFVAEEEVDVLEAHAHGLRNLPREHGFEDLRVEGCIPEDLRGTLYFSGPGLFSLYGHTYRHWFDGDGAITAVHLDRKARGAVRLVESKELKEERAKQQALYTSGSTLAPQWWRRPGMRFKNAANNKPLYWSERLFALFEAGLLTELCPTSLATFRETSLLNTVKGHFCAHYHEVPGRHALYNFSIERGRRNFLHLYELPTRGGRPQLLGSIPIPAGVMMLHDFIATEKHLVFFIPPVRIDLLPVLLGLKAPLEAARWRAEQGTIVLVVPIDAPERYRQFEVEPFFQYHFMNAFEHGDEILVDFVRVSDFHAAHATHLAEQRLEKRATNGRLHRAVLRPGTQKLSLEPLWDEACEFPQVAPAVQATRHRYGYALASDPGAPLTRITKMDMENGRTEEFDLGPAQFPSEALFVPRAGACAEDDGYLLSLVYDHTSDRSFAAVFNARALSHGPLAKAWFDHHIPKPLHGTWRQQG